VTSGIIDSLNSSKDADVADYLLNTFNPGTTPSQVSHVLELYPQNVSAGSPFDTGSLNALTPQFKRIAAILGDAGFQAPRRFFLNYTSGYQDSWVFRECLLNPIGRNITTTHIFI